MGNVALAAWTAVGLESSGEAGDKRITPAVASTKGVSELRSAVVWDEF